MDSDALLKVLLGFYLTVMYGIAFIVGYLSGNIDATVIGTLVSGFTNTLLGVFAYNIHKRKVEKLKNGEDKKDIGEA